jgi:hypothetical protein
MLIAGTMTATFIALTAVKRHIPRLTGSYAGKPVIAPAAH